ncbi:SGNH/GDSL hydrolase family protein [Telmatospirillum sp.]|uniref:SGNH/GDSL hydrolase family protein n=1 Tax=Telmatospirillum sp. TaxID=2079197 RepID=UPI002849FD43|nr:SGNH/GDSL hydrolase family protein [Telmatospirillum sp.]MDR3439654.1 SGNH/GDSL hydrolase family protein [Telmatospirillum sp.]
MAGLLAMPHPAAAVEDRRCWAGEDILLGPSALPRTLAALRHQRTLTVVAIGSSSTQGYGASQPNHSYPAQLAARLKLRFPRSIIRVSNKGVGGDDIDTMIARFPKDVFAEKPDLVIWQTGTNDAINHVPIAHFAALLARGLRDLKNRGIDVILMTPQYAPQFTDVADHASYLEAMRKAGVTVFDRFASSKAWFTDRHFADSPVLTRDGLHQTDSGYHCVAILLADRLAALASAP